MNRIPELVPISDMRQRQNDILASLSGQPIVLTQHGRSAAVLVSPEEWNRIVEELEDLQDALDAIEAKNEPGAISFGDYLTSRGSSVSPAAEA
ncbi:MAG: type II toxin-antitoxin system prevent-host-death family antitoxin [Chloroflexota bacterium]|nr:type II toxin-antitoxin system prevent-host-death family antitoxin [Chloroflexota bacterium]